MHLFVFFKVYTEEYCSDITLLGLQHKQGFQNQHQSNSSPLHNWRISFKEVYSFYLLITSSTEPSLELLDQAVRVSLELE